MAVGRRPNTVLFGDSSSYGAVERGWENIAACQMAGLKLRLQFES